MLYSERVLKELGKELSINPEEFIEDLLINNYKFKFNSHDYEEVVKTYILEHYLIKYYNNPKTKELRTLMKNKLHTLITLYEKNPTISENSMILTNKTLLEQMLSEEDYKRYARLHRELNKNAKAISEKAKSGIKISDDELNTLMTFFIDYMKNSYMTDTNNKKIDELIDDYVKAILRNNEMPSRESELLMLLNYAAIYRVKAEGKKMNDIPDVRLANLSTESSFRGGTCTDKFVCLNDHLSTLGGHFYNSLDQVLKTTIHETTHFIQYRQVSKEMESSRAFDMAIFELFGCEEYKTGRNYTYNEIEEDANRFGYYYARCLYHLAGNKETAEKLRENEKTDVSNRKDHFEYVTVKINDKEKRMPKEKYNVERLNEAVINNISLLEQYPVLKILYNEDGTNKSLENILNIPFTSHDKERLQLDFILYYVSNGELNNINLEKYDDNTKRMIIERLMNVLAREVDYAVDTIDDEMFTQKEKELEELYLKDKNNLKGNLYLLSFNRHLSQIFKIYLFVKNEVNWMSEYEEKHPGYYQLFTTLNGVLRRLDKKVRNFRKYNDSIIIKDFFNEVDPCLTDMFQTRLKFDRDIYISKLKKYFSDSLDNVLERSTYNITINEYIDTVLYNMINEDHYIINPEGIYAKNEDGTFMNPYDFMKYIINTSVRSNDENKKRG